MRLISNKFVFVDEDGGAKFLSSFKGKILFFKEDR